MFGPSVKTSTPSAGLPAFEIDSSLWPYHPENTRSLKSTPAPGFSLLLMQILGGYNNDSSNWVPAAHVRDLDWLPSSWLWPSPSLVTAGIWGSISTDGNSLSLLNKQIFFKRAKNNNQTTSSCSRKNGPLPLMSHCSICAWCLQLSPSSWNYDGI